jgi:hypothetical protein
MNGRAYSAKELRELRELIEENRRSLMEKWHEYFGSHCPKGKKPGILNCSIVFAGFSPQTEMSPM